MEKRFDHKQEQLRLAQQWETERTYALEYNPGQLYSIDTPPPTVSGKLHVGHLFSYTQTDILARFIRMSGKSVYYPFGYDGNGLPTERFVEKITKTSIAKIGRSAFIQLCLEKTVEIEAEFKAIWKQVGLSVNWDHTYSTISDRVRQISQESFIHLYKKGHIYRKNEPALYCTTCRTSVAQAELDDLEMQSTFNNITFSDHRGNELIIATTRPELLPACVAVFYHPDDSRYQYLAGTKAIIPLFDREVPILPDKHVQPEKGTGLVMCCTFGDKMDIMWFKIHNLPYRQIIGFNGKLTAEAGPLEDLKTTAAREKIIELLKQKKLLVSQKPIVHAVNVHERCKKEIEFVMISQWFLGILKHKSTFVDLAHKIRWYPEHMKSRYLNWVENINWDWCLSRQRVYGIPFPAWHCQDCGYIILAETNSLPIDPQEKAPPTQQCPECKSCNIAPDTDVMDTWNTSSITPYICADLLKNQNTSPFEANNTFLPMNMRPQAHDIIRTWAFYTIVKAWLHSKEIPWKDIVISGHVLSTEKEKLSKSKDNAFSSPEQLLQQYPADAIRYWTASGGLGHDIAFSDAQLKIGQRLTTKLWNAFRFISAHVDVQARLEQFGTTPGLINQWIIDRAAACHQSYVTELEQYEFGTALDHAEQFFWSDFCDNYLELVKDQLFKPEKYSPEQIQETKWTLSVVGLRILQLFAPYMPYVTEAIYEQLYLQTYGPSLHTTKYTEIDVLLSHFPEASTQMQWLLSAIAHIRKLKSQQQLSLKVELKTVTVSVSKQSACATIMDHETILKGIIRAHSLTCEHVPDASQNASALIKNPDGTWHARVALDFESLS